MASSSSSSADIVKLNVGGRLFQTTRFTLTASDPDSMLAKMFSGPLDPAKLDENGAYFIDADPGVFKIILEFLRRGQVTVDDAGMKKRLRIEADYFNLAGLARELAPPKEVGPPGGGGTQRVILIDVHAVNYMGAYQVYQVGDATCIKRMANDVTLISGLNPNRARLFVDSNEWDCDDNPFHFVAGFPRLPEKPLTRYDPGVPDRSVFICQKSKDVSSTLLPNEHVKKIHDDVMANFEHYWIEPRQRTVQAFCY